MKSPKIKSLKELQVTTSRLKLEGKKIVLVHGIFDILHMGHVELLRRAKNLGDILIVGIDHDYNAKLLKGKNRPINNHKNRMHIVSSVQFVDFVFLIKPFKTKEKAFAHFNNLYTKLLPNIVATSIGAGKHGHLKKANAKLIGAKFVNIEHPYSNLRTTRIARLLGIE